MIGRRSKHPTGAERRDGIAHGMTIDADQGSEPAFDPRRAARRLLREGRGAALATLDEAGAPYASLVAVATGADGAPLILISELAVHTRNLRRDPRASLLIDRRGTSDPTAGSRVSLGGAMEETDAPEARRRFLARHPGAFYADFKDFRFWRMRLERAHLVAGFGRIVDIAPADLLDDVSDAPDLVEHEAYIAAHMNENYADVVRLYATRLLGRRDGDWRFAGLDPEGCDLLLDGELARLDFPQRVRNPGVLRHVLKALAEEARASS